MIQVLYTSASGLTSQQKNIDVIAGNIANVNTDGYKASRFDFQDCLYMRMQSPTDNSPVKNLQRGAGAIEYQTARMFLQGPLRNTDRKLDFAIEGNGFFMVENPRPLEELEGMDEILYTRSGDFYISPDADGLPGGWLVDSAGRFVLSSENERIYIENLADLHIRPDGTLQTEGENGEMLDLANLGLTDFTNRMGLAATGDNLYMATENTGEQIPALGDIKTYSLEGSNVDYAEEVTRVIRAQRAYQIAAKCVTTADQMMQQVNNIRQ